MVQAYGKAQGSNYAAGLAFNAFLAMFPLILGMLSIVGLAIHDQALQNKLYDGIVSVFPKDAHDSILSALSGVKHNAGILGIVSIAGLLWSGTSLFASMEFALTMIFGTKQRDTLRQRVMGLVMVVVFSAAVLLSVTANSAAAASPGAGGVLGSVLGAVVLMGLMTLIYRWVPNRTFALKDLWPGALLAGVLIEVSRLSSHCTPRSPRDSAPTASSSPSSSCWRPGWPSCASSSSSARCSTRCASARRPTKVSFPPGPQTAANTRIPPRPSTK